MKCNYLQEKDFSIKFLQNKKNNFFFNHFLILFATIINIISIVKINCNDSDNTNYYKNMNKNYLENEENQIKPNPFNFQYPQNLQSQNNNFLSRTNNNNNMNNMIPNMQPPNYTNNKNNLQPHILPNPNLSNLGQERLVSPSIIGNYEEPLYQGGEINEMCNPKNSCISCQNTLYNLKFKENGECQFNKCLNKVS
jgi:hypothetical protein